MLIIKFYYLLPNLQFSIHLVLVVVPPILAPNTLPRVRGGARLLQMYYFGADLKLSIQQFSVRFLLTNFPTLL